MEAEPPEFRSQAEPGNEKIYKSVMPIFMYEGGYWAIGPAMLVYRENTTLVTRESTRLFSW